ncbi:MAG: methylenetetrahydrofolate reductase [Ignavibacteriales bacterium]|nr:MAG: methylenetetrahydrofolate reductase [NAD(P)H] [Ignavibacteriaceae bacterium]MBW7873214.1 methylenetetrahydrofolate reductase [Ignavibacteria bacterium]MCZ2142856.1 methylenetetrahydrofolate reductase [Ignavibacteriales bacterium]MBV6443950.1 5,10-methylenetetrahydrofolate reductase [Ignavibacteriaceae bacterium]MBZ0197646.1 methylenetetrahydrofolate reductase [Ignavibacteriaceae bacterium]
MKVTEILASTKEPLISFEIIPPKRGGDIKSLLNTIESISHYKPPFIDITSHAAEMVYEETANGIKKKVIRKRPGTLGICALIQNKYHIEAVPHILCKNFTKEETEDFLIELGYLGVNNVLAIQGDDKGFEKTVSEGRTTNKHAIDLVKQINDMNHGVYLEEGLLDAKPSDFCIGVSGYPEKHYEAPNLKTDMMYTKQKIDAGAEYIVTQMFFDNQAFFRYCNLAKEMEINAPILPGLKILTSKAHLTGIPKNFYINVPEELTAEIMEAKPEHVMEIGVNWAAKQAEELINAGVSCLHFYIMQNPKPVDMLMKKLGF